MNSKHLSPCAFAALTVSPAFLSPPAWGDHLKQSITISGGMGPAGSVSTSDFKAFDNSLGTLVDISFTLAGTLDYTGRGLPVDEGAKLGLADPKRLPDVAFDWFPKVGSGLAAATTR